jgi:hypothetical protein
LINLKIKPISYTTTLFFATERKERLREPWLSSTGGRLRKRDNLLTGEWGRGGGGAKTYDGEKACSSMDDATLPA